ncbi:MAG: bifunctional 23S rRNA (guanine(2069)-N(7))-methyltransferase RlmK/23S rRNA (guanine(2445)-N(2))-methyltransferase RlmL [Gammaproteobacteria bacterium]|nr:MAG: bifunctional 23S rRNA (guanine(2069)-N(7))-methyltransferase RlmK/23S rRNA (guanine(2445)-N(2))-methyltransferase RlmL [Gammaproteobacteria bacterium]
MQNLKLFITGHKGFETLLLHELRAILKPTDAVLRKVYGGVEVDATISAVYLVCLHSRLANRVFCELAQAVAASESQLYEAVYQVEWEKHLQPRNSIAVSATVSRSKLDHGHFVALKTKDAIVDRMRNVCGSRPSVEKKQPDIRIHVHLHQNRASISLDLSGESLHRRGYRTRHAGAPLKEHLAAALLSQAGWNHERSKHLRLLDPMCGSGTFVIEAAMIAANIAPGLKREYFGFDQWLQHDADLWQQHLQQARRQVQKDSEVVIYASDYDINALETARDNAERAGVAQIIEFSQQQIAELELPPSTTETLVICNPPYGRRLQSEAGLDQLYRDLGDAVRRLEPARLAIISANPDLLHHLKLKRLSRKDVRNGPLDCLFAQFETVAEAADRARISSEDANIDETALPLRNRLEKNARHLQRWARRNDVSCYRLYDADLPEFSFALDRYQSEIAPEQAWFHLQEYQAPATVDADLAARRIDLAARVVCQLFGISSEQLFCKTRSRQRGSEQYRKQAHRGEYFQVREGAASLLINLSDYLDSGLFLDHRITRQRVYQAARGKDLLNLFCYTGTVGVQAGLGGACSVMNVDLSQTYLEWARQNHRLNGLDDEERYRFLRADIVELLKKPARYPLKTNYDLIFFDPPSFSNSSKMQQTLDIQRDHTVMIRQAMSLLAADGLLLFSTNRRGFRLDEEISREFDARDISRATIPEDFKRNPKIHRCWEIRHAHA